MCEHEEDIMSSQKCLVSTGSESEIDKVNLLNIKRGKLKVTSSFLSARRK